VGGLPCRRPVLRGRVVDGRGLTAPSPSAPSSPSRWLAMATRVCYWPDSARSRSGGGGVAACMPDGWIWARDGRSSPGSSGLW
jgi:hypothetical protein